MVDYSETLNDVENENEHINLEITALLNAGNEEPENPNYTAYAIKLVQFEEKIRDMTVMETEGTLGAKK